MEDGGWVITQLIFTDGLQCPWTCDNRLASVAFLGALSKWGSYCCSTMHAHQHTFVHRHCLYGDLYTCPNLCISPAKGPWFAHISILCKLPKSEPATKHSLLCHYEELIIYSNKLYILLICLLLVTSNALAMPPISDVLWYPPHGSWQHRQDAAHRHATCMCTHSHTQYIIWVYYPIKITGGNAKCWLG